MSLIEQGLLTHLQADAGITAIVDGRIDAVVSPQNETLPRITFQRISSNRVMSFGGPSGLTRGRFQIDCWAATYDDSKNLAEAVRLAMDGFSGLMGDVPVRVILLTDNDLFEANPKTYRVSMDFAIWYEETKP